MLVLNSAGGQQADLAGRRHSVVAIYGSSICQGPRWLAGSTSCCGSNASADSTS
jgi:hypothetical protein